MIHLPQNPPFSGGRPRTVSRVFVVMRGPSPRVVCPHAPLLSPFPQPQHPASFLPLDISRQQAPDVPPCVQLLSLASDCWGWFTCSRGEHSVPLSGSSDVAVCVTTSCLSVVCWWSFWLCALFSCSEQSCRDVRVWRVGRACWPCVVAVGAAHRCRAGVLPSLSSASKQQLSLD